MDFSQALIEVKRGDGIRLPHWADDVVIRGQFPDEHSKMTEKYLYVESHYGKVPWIPTQLELFNNDWEGCI